MSLEPEAVIDCIDCGGRAHLLSKPDDFGWEHGQLVMYRCEDCLDGWYLVLEDDDRE
ncbi:MAG: hypothetical protein QOJ09_2170 [Actinomycetota bacterium]|nr:hypothetical protein [Actinomycetota bacterium]